jgi:transposase
MAARGWRAGGYRRSRRHWGRVWCATRVRGSCSRWGVIQAWISRQLKAEGFEVIVANPRRVRLIAESDKKSDRYDAEQLARLGRLDPGLLSPIVHRGERAQRDRILLLARDGLVRARTRLINQVRGFAKALGTRLPSSSCEAFPKRVRNAVGEALFPGLGTMLAMIEQLTAEIRSMDRAVERMCREGYKETGVLRQISGVGPLTALAFVLTLEDPQRFAKSRDVGAYLGLARGSETRERSVRSCGSPRQATVCFVACW